MHHLFKVAQFMCEHRIIRCLKYPFRLKQKKKIILFCSMFWENVYIKSLTGYLLESSSPIKQFMLLVVSEFVGEGEEGEIAERAEPDEGEDFMK